MASGGLEFQKVEQFPDSSGVPLPDVGGSQPEIPPGRVAEARNAGDQEQTASEVDAESLAIGASATEKPDSFRQSLQEFSGTKEGWQEEIGQKGWEAYSTRPLIMDFGQDVERAFPLESHSEILKGILTGLGVLDHEINRKTLQRAVYYALGVTLEDGLTQEKVQAFFREQIVPRFKNFTDELRKVGFQEEEFSRMTRLFSQYTGLNFIDENGVFQISGLTAFLTVPMAEIEKKVQLFNQYREGLSKQLEPKPLGDDFDTRIGKVSEIVEFSEPYFPASLIDSSLKSLSSWGVLEADNNKEALARAICDLEMQYRSKLDSSKSEEEQKKEVSSFLESFVLSRFHVFEDALKKVFPGKPLPDVIFQFSEKSGLHFIDANKNLQPEGLRTFLSLSDAAIQQKVELFHEHAEFEGLFFSSPKKEAIASAIKKAEESLPEGSRFGARLFRLFRWLLSLSGVAEKVVDSIVHPPESDKEAQDLVRREELWRELNRHLFGDSDQKLPKDLFVPQEGKSENKSNLGIFRVIFHKKHEGTYADYSSFFQAYIKPEEKRQLIEACNRGDFADEGKKGMALLKDVFKKTAR